MLLSVSHHLEPAYGAFTRSQALDEWVGLIVTTGYAFWGRSEPGAFCTRGLVLWRPACVVHAEQTPTATEIRLFKSGS